MSKILPFILCALFFSSPVFAEEKFDKNHFCDPMMSNADISECMNKYYYDLEAKLKDAEKNALNKANEFKNMSDDTNSVAYQNFPGQTEKSILAFHNYREEECNRVKEAYGTGSLAGNGYISCKIELTTQRIKKLEKLI